MEIKFNLMIPKIIHYCWFGKKRKPKLVQDCISSWKEKLPDYKIIEWNEKNSDLTHPFVKQALKIKKWAFVADYIRLKVLHEFGGVYLDTDMLILREIDELLKNCCFFGAEDNEFISCGIIGAKPNFYFFEKILEIYNSIFISDNLGQITIPRIITEQFKEENNFIGNFENIIVFNKIVIYPASYFYPLPYEKKDDILNFKKYLQPNSYSVHLWNSSWIDYSEFYYFENRQYIKGFLKVFNKIVVARKLDWQYLKKVISFFLKSIR